MPGAPEYAPDKPGRQQTITDPQLGQGEADPAALFEEPHHQGGCKPGHYERCLVLRGENAREKTDEVSESDRLTSPRPLLMPSGNTEGVATMRPPARPSKSPSGRRWIGPVRTDSTGMSPSRGRCEIVANLDDAVVMRPSRACRT